MLLNRDNGFKMDDDRNPGVLDIIQFLFQALDILILSGDEGPGAGEEDLIGQVDTVQPIGSRFQCRIFNALYGQP